MWNCSFEQVHKTIHQFLYAIKYLRFVLQHTVYWDQFAQVLFSGLLYVIKLVHLIRIRRFVKRFNQFIRKIRLKRTIHSQSGRRNYWTNSWMLEEIPLYLYQDHIFTPYRTKSIPAHCFKVILKTMRSLHLNIFTQQVRITTRLRAA